MGPGSLGPIGGYRITRAAVGQNKVLLAAHGLYPTRGLGPGSTVQSATSSAGKEVWRFGVAAVLEARGLCASVCEVSGRQTQLGE